MEPFIGLGLVNIIPNPVEFDLDLMSAMMEMARTRSRTRTRDIPCEQDRLLHYRLFIEDLLNTMAMMPKNVKVRTLVQQFRLSEEEAAKAITELENNAEASPLMMLQQMNAGNGGQFIQGGCRS